MSADAHHTLLDGRIGAHFTLLEEKVNATFWPVYVSIALREHSCPAYPLLKFPKQGVETIEVVQSAHAITTKMYMPEACKRTSSHRGMETALMHWSGGLNRTSMADSRRLLR